MLAIRMLALSASNSGRAGWDAGGRNTVVFRVQIPKKTLPTINISD
jgi:hypothetical protein